MSEKAASEWHLKGLGARGPDPTLKGELIYKKELRLMEEFKVDFVAAGLSQDGTRYRVKKYRRL